MPPGVSVSELESDGGDLFFCGGGSSGKVRTSAPPQTRLRDGQRLHEEVIEAALAAVFDTSTSRRYYFILNSSGIRSGQRL